MAAGVCARRKRPVDYDQVAGAGIIDRLLDCGVGGILPVDHRGSFAANRDCDGINGRLAVGCRDYQFTAACAGVAHLLPGAERNVSTHVDRKRCVTPARDALVSATDRDATLTCPEAVMAGYELLVVGCRACRRT